MREYEEILELYPTLTLVGLEKKIDSEEKKTARNNLEGKKQRVMQIAKYLEFFPRRKNLIKTMSSYGLKHKLEVAIGYMTNGEFIAACLLVGGRIVACRGYSRNCYTNIKIPNIKIAKPETSDYTIEE